MILCDNMFGNLPSQCIVIGLPVLAALMALAAVAWWRVGRAAACRPHAVEHRVWTFCPKCGWPRPEAGDALRAPDSLLPSDLLRQAWTRSPALDRDGRVVLPSDEKAVAWSLWGAGNSVLEAGSQRWSAWTGAVTEILGERHGGMSVQVFNRHPGTTQSSVVAMAVEAEMRAGLTARRRSSNTARV